MLVTFLPTRRGSRAGAGDPAADVGGARLTGAARDGSLEMFKEGTDLGGPPYPRREELYKTPLTLREPTRPGCAPALKLALNVGRGSLAGSEEVDRGGRGRPLLAAGDGPRSAARIMVGSLRRSCGRVARGPTASFPSLRRAWGRR